MHSLIPEFDHKAYGGSIQNLYLPDLEFAE
jgi:hypothetical protein